MVDKKLEDNMDQSDIRKLHELENYKSRVLTLPNNTTYNKSRWEDAKVTRLGSIINCINLIYKKSSTIDMSISDVQFKPESVDEMFGV